MRIGVPREIKADENRVAITPAGVTSFVKFGHEVYIEKDAGFGSGISDGEYEAAGARILDRATDVFAIADMILKVKEPLPPEYDLLTPGKVLFTYLHLAPEPELTKALVRNKVVAIAYETVQKKDGTLPLLTPMSEVAGKMATQIGAHLLEKRNGGRGILLGGVAGVPPASVTIIGGGTVGTAAAKVAVGMGATVTILDLNVERLRYLDDIFGGHVITLMSNSFNISESVKDADLLIGAVLVPGARAPRLVTEDMVRAMRPGSVIVDVAIDQGGSVETIDRVTTHSSPTYVKHGVVHYSVANMPGAVPRTSTFALTNATMPYALKLANKGYIATIKEDRALALGVNVISGTVTYRAVAEAHSLPYTPLSEVVGM
ncbi:MAG: alanine dehydrogenase [Firmicutes bacterium]|nr:alanine dehydrogenase [Bacillota bacterium]